MGTTKLFQHESGRSNELVRIVRHDAGVRPVRVVVGRAVAGIADDKRELPHARDAQPEFLGSVVTAGARADGLPVEAGYTNGFLVLALSALAATVVAVFVPVAAVAASMSAKPNTNMPRWHRVASPRRARTSATRTSSPPPPDQLGPGPSAPAGSWGTSTPRARGRARPAW